MREDLSKVITERGGRAQPNPIKYRGRVKYVNDPEYDYPKEFGGIQKNFNDYDDHDSYERTNVIEGILFKNLGRPWDKIYSEFCAVLKPGHQRAYLKWLVEKNTFIKDGKVYEKSGRWSWATFEVTGFYVHPKTGLLCHIQRKSRRHSYKKKVYIPVPDKPGWFYRKFNGLWFQEFDKYEHDHQSTSYYYPNTWMKQWIDKQREKDSKAGYILKSCNHREIKYIEEQLSKYDYSV